MGRVIPGSVWELESSFATGSTESLEVEAVTGAARDHEDPGRQCGEVAENATFLAIVNVLDHALAVSRQPQCSHLILE